jgi:hypothetical protein
VPAGSWPGPSFRCGAAGAGGAGGPVGRVTGAGLRAGGAALRAGGTAGRGAGGVMRARDTEAGRAAAAASSAAASCCGCGRDTSRARIAALTVTFIPGMAASPLSVARLGAAEPAQAPCGTSVWWQKCTRAGASDRIRPSEPRHATGSLAWPGNRSASGGPPN